MNLKDKLYFKNVTTVGDLYLDIVLNNFEDENIVFICKDIECNYYFCICYDFRLTLEWALCKVEHHTLLDVLEKKIDLYTVFEKSETDIIQIIYSDTYGESSELISFQQFDKILLPDKGVYLIEDDTKALTNYIDSIYYEILSYKNSTSDEFILNLDSTKLFH